MFQFKCPICGKRLFDASKIPKEEIIISTKCKNCNNAPEVKLIKENIKTENIPSKGIR